MKWFSVKGRNIFQERENIREVEELSFDTKVG